jgi:hypothetical protein
MPDFFAIRRSLVYAIRASMKLTPFSVRYIANQGV